MKINAIHYSDKFVKLFEEMPQSIQNKAIKSLKQLESNPFHKSLRLHKLQRKFDGLRSISLSMHYRIIFEQYENGDILLLSIGTHSIYQG